MSTSGKWEQGKRALKAVQIAFDVGDEVNHRIRLEALEKGINPPDRIRQILGLPVTRKPVRPRLSISLSEKDFRILSEKFGVSPADRLKIRQLAAEMLIAHLQDDPDD
ncbi:MAG: hypothetical protein O2780_06920 [Proteobacteria bacterium]|jgi:hypothetical protein|nr:hypothetical protein [Pseudomonadota bacterium]MDA1300943.1 hypothetical protein [Pseudomonadota bacterium]